MSEEGPRGPFFFGVYICARIYKNCILPIMTKEKKAGRYARMYAQAETLIKATTHPVSRMATLTALLHHNKAGSSGPVFICWSRALWWWVLTRDRWPV